jgi:hypothetical protein
MLGFYIGDEIYEEDNTFSDAFCIWLKPLYPPSATTAPYNLSLSHSSLCGGGRGLPKPDEMEITKNKK